MDRKAAERQAAFARKHIVIGLAKPDEGTQALRDLVADLGGVQQAARLLEEDRATVVAWTQKGIPEDRILEVKKLYAAHKGSNLGPPQNPRYEVGTDFRMVR